MLIGRDDISNDVITFGVCFHMFFNLCLRSRWFPFCADILAKISPLSRRKLQGIVRGIQISKDVIASSPSLSHRAARSPQRASSLAKTCTE